MLSNRTLRLNEIITRPDMAHILHHAPDVLYLLRFAALQVDARDRWQLYEILKSLAALRVGRQAAHPALRTSACYDAVRDAIDALLPSETDSEQEQSA